MTGLALVAGYTLLGAAWLVLKTEGPLQSWAYAVARRMLAAVMLFFVVISVWTPLAESRVMDRWLGNMDWLWIFPLVTLAAAAWLWRAIENRREGVPFVATLVLFITFYVGLLISMWPLAVPPDHTFWDAASAPGSQLFLLIGVLFITPVILGYTAWTYWVFRGKVTAESSGYH